MGKKKKKKNNVRSNVEYSFNPLLIDNLNEDMDLINVKRFEGNCKMWSSIIRIMSILMMVNFPFLFNSVDFLSGSYYLCNSNKCQLSFDCHSREYPSRNWIYCE